MLVSILLDHLNITRKIKHERQKKDNILLEPRYKDTNQGKWFIDNEQATNWIASDSNALETELQTGRYFGT